VKLLGVSPGSVLNIYYFTVTQSQGAKKAANSHSPPIRRLVLSGDGMRSWLYAFLVIVGTMMLGCQPTEKSPSTGKQATDPPTIPTNATSPKPVTQ